MFGFNKVGYFFYILVINLFFGLNEVIVMLREEGMVNVFVCYVCYGKVIWVVVEVWGLDILC